MRHKKRYCINPPSKMLIYKSERDILDRHGLLIWLMYLITKIIEHATPSHHLRALPERFGFRFARDKRFPKPAAWWQDVASVGTMILLTGIAIPLSWSSRSTLSYIGILTAVVALIDSVNYLIRVLWFDDLRPRITEYKRAVSSHRRILFIVFLSYAQTILLFSVFYHLMVVNSSKTYLSLLEISFLTATLLDSLKPIGFPTVFQVGVSVFFLVVAIAVIGAISYGRPELSERRK